MRRKFFIRVVLVVALSAAAVQAQNRSTINGYVYGPQRVPVERAQVELRNEVNTTIARTWTESSGRFFFSAVPSGRLAVHVTAVGTALAEQTQEIEITGVGVRGQAIPENVQMEFYLRPRKQAQEGTPGVVFAQDVPDEARTKFAAALVDLDGGRTSQGLEQLRQALEIFPNYFLALERLGAEYMRMEKFDDARKAFRSAAAVNVNSFQSWYGLSYSDYKLEKFDGSVEAATRATDIDKTSAVAWFVLGLSQRRLRKFDEAEQALLQAKRLDKGKTPEINWNLALLYTYNLKRYDDAADELENYLKAAPKDPNADRIKKLIKDLRENRPPRPAN